MKKKEISRRGHREPALLKSAKKLFFKFGYAGTTMERVAFDAGFSKRTVYIYFKNKVELFLGVAEIGMEILKARLLAIPVDKMDVNDSINSILETYLWFAKEHSSYYKMIFQEATANMIETAGIELRDKWATYERQCLGVVARVSQKAMDEGIIAEIEPMEAAHIFWGTAAGILLLSMGGSQTVTAEKSREELIRKAIWTLLRGLQTDVNVKGENLAQGK